MVHLVVDLVEEIHAMIGETREEDTERSLETGGSCPRESNTDHLHISLNTSLAFISDLQDLLEVAGNCDLLETPMLTTD